MGTKETTIRLEDQYGFGMAKFALVGNTWYLTKLYIKENADGFDGILMLDRLKNEAKARKIDIRWE